MNRLTRAHRKKGVIGSTWRGLKTVKERDELGFEKDWSPSPWLPTIMLNHELYLDLGSNSRKRAASDYS